VTRYLYYPGCAMDGSARAYGESLRVVCERLRIELAEVDDWNCCGATEFVGVSTTAAYALIGRNLALAAGQADGGTRTLVAPCSACYLNLAKADYYMKERPALGTRVNAALTAGGLHYEPGSLAVRHLLDIIVHDVGLDALRAAVVRPLSGLRVAPYLGCMVPRPDCERRWSDHEQPVELDRLLAALGADVVEFPLKTHCCGGHMPHIRPATAFELIHRLLASAQSHGADLMATVCPMCQINIDAYQREANRHVGVARRMPILFFTQLMGLAFGASPDAVGIGRELVSARQALRQIGRAAPAEPAAKPRRPGRKDPSLPMPRPRVAQEAPEVKP